MHLLVGYREFKKIQVRGESGLIPRKTLPEKSLITSEVTQRLGICVYEDAKFSIATDFFSICMV